MLVRNTQDPIADNSNELLLKLAHGNTLLEVCAADGYWQDALVSSATQSRQVCNNAARR